MQEASNVERWNALLALARSKIVDDCSGWRTLCFGEDVVQLLSHIVEACVY